MNVNGYGMRLSNDIQIDDVANVPRVIHYTDERVVDPAGKKCALTWRSYHSARNLIVDACRLHGSVGPFGRFGVDSDSPEPIYSDAEPGPESPDFWINSDQHNHERYLYLSVLNSTCLTASWLASVCAALSGMDAWGLCIDNIKNGYAIIFETMILLSGTVFEACNSPKEFLEIAGRNLQV